MYIEFYGLREKPFSLSPDPRYLFLADSHREALAHLLYGIEHGEGFIAITGEVGTGKTTLCRTLLQRIEPGTEVAFIFNPQLSAQELLQAINAELGLPTEAVGRRELMEQLNRFLLAKKAEGRRVLLLIDEAQNLAPDTLEQVRLLSNLETDTSKLIQIILIGQPELDAILESPDLRQLRQRISVRWRLSPLSAIETRDYVRHRLRIAAGASREIFTELALREVHRRSRGIPRLVNLLCDRALLAGYAASARTIGLGLVTQSDQEVRGGGRPLALPTSAGAAAALSLSNPLALAAGALLLVGVGVAGSLTLQRFGPPWSADAASPASPVAAAPPAGSRPSATAPSTAPRADTARSPAVPAMPAAQPVEPTPAVAEPSGTAAQPLPGAAAQPALPELQAVSPSPEPAPAVPLASPTPPALASGTPPALAAPALPAGAASDPARGAPPSDPFAANGTDATSPLAPLEPPVLAAAPPIEPRDVLAAAPPIEPRDTFAAVPPVAPAAAAPVPAGPALDDVLAASSPAAASAEALRAVFAVWGTVAEAPPYLPSLDDALVRLEGAGFSVLALRNANLATLEL
ncbi:MAG TPA: AAA family ATPase, partial [Myxococcota bacterium]|nr:AAA family ATPase [Myxococcota bacterium]